MRLQKCLHVLVCDGVLTLSKQRTAEVLDDAVHWLVREGEPDIQHRVHALGAGHTCFIALHHIFTECESAFRSSRSCGCVHGLGVL